MPLSPLKMVRPTNEVCRKHKFPFLLVYSRKYYIILSGRVACCLFAKSHSLYILYANPSSQDEQQTRYPFRIFLLAHNTPSSYQTEFMKNIFSHRNYENMSRTFASLLMRTCGFSFIEWSVRGHNFPRVCRWLSPFSQFAQRKLCDARGSKVRRSCIIISTEHSIPPFPAQVDFMKTPRARDVHGKSRTCIYTYMLHPPSSSALMPRGIRVESAS